MGRHRKYASAAERQAAYRARRKAELDTKSGEEALRVLDSKMGETLKKGQTHMEDLLEKSVEQLQELGFKDTVIKFILQKQL